MEAKFNVGDKVRLIDGRTKMLVIGVSDPKQDEHFVYECTWEEKGAGARKNTFPEVALEKAPIPRVGTTTFSSAG